MIQRLVRAIARRKAGNRTGVDYEGAWNTYARLWRKNQPGLVNIGDEWIGHEAGAASSLQEYEQLIERRFIEPYIRLEDTVLEIGIGGGRTAALLLKHCNRLICADISNEMIRETRRRLGTERVSYVKLDGRTLDGIGQKSIDICFSYDTMVHLEPRDIFNYLRLIPSLMRGNRCCIFHHANVLSELGWKRCLNELDQNLMGKRHGGAFSVMTDSIMDRFLSHLNYQVVLKDVTSVPRDCIWVCRAPIIANCLDR